MKRVIGVTGGVGSGKSQVLAILSQDFNARVILADEVAHSLMEPGEKGYCQVIAALGTGFLKPDGQIDRKKLADLIFSDKKALETMNRIIHPMTWAAVKEMAESAPEELVIVESALMGEEQRADYEEIWYICVSQEERIQRLMKSRGYSRNKCLDIMASQKGEEDFRAISDRVIDNNGSLGDTKRQIEMILSSETTGKGINRNHEIC